VFSHHRAHLPTAGRVSTVKLRHPMFRRTVRHAPVLVISLVRITTIYTMSGKTWVFWKKFLCYYMHRRLMESYFWKD